jgi:hypothetical protein
LKIFFNLPRSGRGKIFEQKSVGPTKQILGLFETRLEKNLGKLKLISSNESVTVWILYLTPEPIAHLFLCGYYDVRGLRLKFPFDPYTGQLLAQHKPC